MFNHTIKMIFHTMTIILTILYPTLGSPTDRFNKTDEQSHVEDKFIQLPNRVAGAKVAKWNESSGGNPEELGNYAEGDIILPGRDAILWPNGRVYYEISPDFDDQQLKRIKKAMAHISKQTCINFVARSSYQPDYVKFAADDTGCWTTGIGRLGGVQLVNLQVPWCLRKVGSVVHEIMHVLGFGHEHNRADRDQYVDILWQNVDNGYAKNFNKTETHETILDLPYDPYSIMHYSPGAFTSNKQLRTIEPKSSNVHLEQMGQRKGLTSLDVQKINKLYEDQCSL